MNETPPTPLEVAFVMDDVCPRCLGELDTGYECNDCGFDAITIVAYIDTSVP